MEGFRGISEKENGYYQGFIWTEAEMKEINIPLNVRVIIRQSRGWFRRSRFVRVHNWTVGNLEASVKSRRMWLLFLVASWGLFLEAVKSLLKIGGEE